MFQHIVYSLANRQGLFAAYVRTCKTRLDTTTKVMVVVTSLFNFIIPWQHVLSCMNIEHDCWFIMNHDGSNNVVQVCSFIKQFLPTCMNKPARQQHCSSWPAQQYSRPVQACRHGSGNKLCVFMCVLMSKSRRSADKTE